VRLMPGQTHKLQINWMDGISGGFRGANFTPASEYHWQFTAKSAEAKTGAAKPAVVRISPPAGETLPVLTLLEITFDQPMMPLDQGFPWLRKTGSPFDLPALVPAFDYDPSAHRFTVPVALPPDNDTKLTLEGFYSADGVAGDPVSIRCQIGTDSISRPQQERIATAARDPRLEQLLSSMQSARARLHSGMETVQGTRYRAEKGSFRSISTDSAIFKWQGTNQIFGDISGIMNLKAFILGTDGMTCWLYAENQAKNERRLDSSPAALVSNINTSVADPFALTRRTVAEAIAKEGLVYLGPATVDGRACHHVQSWKVQLPQYEHDRVFAARLEWWIDAETSLPAQVVEISQYAVSTARFRYAQLNQPMPDAAFQPPAGPEQVGQPLFFKQAPAPDETRFLTIRDGCDGRMSGRLGWSGPGGTTSSGLN
jgi:hypothetical protein